MWVRAVGSSATAPWSVYFDFVVAEAAAPTTPAADFDLLTLVFSDSPLMPILGESESRSFDFVTQKADASPIVPPEIPDSLSQRKMTASQTVAAPASEALPV